MEVHYVIPCKTFDRCWCSAVKLTFTVLQPHLLHPLLPPAGQVAVKPCSCPERAQHGRWRVMHGFNLSSGLGLGLGLGLCPGRCLPALQAAAAQQAAVEQCTSRGRRRWAATAPPLAAAAYCSLVG